MESDEGRGEPGSLRPAPPAPDNPPGSLRPAPPAPDNPPGRTGFDRRPGSFLVVQALTFVRIPLSVAFAACLLSLGWSSAGVRTLLLLLLIFAETTDWLDGLVARRLGVVSEWGAMYDPYADSVSRLIVYWAEAVSGLVTPLVPLVMALRDVTVAYCRVVLSRHGRTVSAKLSGKIKAHVQAIVAVLALLGPLYWARTGNWTVHALSWIVIVVTAASVIQYVGAALSAGRVVRTSRGPDRPGREAR